MELFVRLLDGPEGDLHVVLLHVLHEQKGVVPFLLGLDPEPVGIALKALFLIKIRKIQIQICAVKLLIDLLIQKLSNTILSHGNASVFE